MTKTVHVNQVRYVPKDLLSLLFNPLSLNLQKQIPKRPVFIAHFITNILLRHPVNLQNTRGGANMEGNLIVIDHLGIAKEPSEDEVTLERNLQTHKMNNDERDEQREGQPMDNNIIPFDI